MQDPVDCRPSDVFPIHNSTDEEEEESTSSSEDEDTTRWQKNLNRILAESRYATEKDKFALFGKDMVNLFMQIKPIREKQVKFEICFLENVDLRNAKFPTCIVVNVGGKNNERHWIVLLSFQKWNWILFDSYGRTIYEIYAENRMPMNFPGIYWSNLGGDYQSEYSVLCGYYCAVFAHVALTDPHCRNDPRNLQKYLDFYFYDFRNQPKNQMTFTTTINDITCLTIFKNVFDYSSIPEAAKFIETIGKEFAEG